MTIKKFSTVITPIIALVCRLVLAAIFFYAAVEKIADPREFAVAIYYYQLLPDFLINFLAIILPFLEILLALCFLSGFYSQGASLVAVFLFLVFASALSINLVRGLDISCGCFGKSSGNINWIYLVRDFSLLVMSLCVLFFDRGWSYFFAKRPLPSE